MILLFSGLGYPTPNMSVYKTTEAEPYLVGPVLQISRVRKQTRPAGPIFNFSRLLSTDVIKTVGVERPLQRYQNIAGPSGLGYLGFWRCSPLPGRRSHPAQVRGIL